MLRKCYSFAALGLLLLASASAPAQPAWLGVRNDTKTPVLVQGMSIFQGQVRRGPGHILLPGQVSWHLILVPGNKLLIISDAKQPTRCLYRETKRLGASDAFFSIQPDLPPGARMPGPVTLVPVVPPPPPPRRGLPGLPGPAPAPPPRLSGPPSPPPARH